MTIMVDEHTHTLKTKNSECQLHLTTAALLSLTRLARGGQLASPCLTSKGIESLKCALLRCWQDQTSCHCLAKVKLQAAIVFVC